jgi:hypothetical protein
MTSPDTTLSRPTAESSATPGESLTLHVSSSVYLYDVSIHRWGVEHELVWSDRDIPGSSRLCRPMPTRTDAAGRSP